MLYDVQEHRQRGFHGFDFLLLFAAACSVDTPGPVEDALQVYEQFYRSFPSHAVRKMCPIHA
jgi:hypothetical protein